MFETVLRDDQIIFLRLDIFPGDNQTPLSGAGVHIIAGDFAQECHQRVPAAEFGGGHFGLGRSLVRRPAIFILDEVWNGLDVQFHARFGSLLAELATGGTTLLLIAHHEEDLPDVIVRRFTIVERGVRERT